VCLETLLPTIAHPGKGKLAERRKERHGGVRYGGAREDDGKKNKGKVKRSGTGVKS